MTDSNTGYFAWYDLLTPDPDAAVAFYSHVIGWKAETFAPGYTMFASGQGPLAGVSKAAADAHGAPPHWTSHVVVADVDHTLARVKSHGGRVLIEPKDVPTVGRYALIADPHGASINVFKPLQSSPMHDTTKP